jgi:hypothetical protein
MEVWMEVYFRDSFSGHGVATAEWAGDKRMKNRKPLRAAEEGGSDVLLATDHGIP